MQMAWHMLSLLPVNSSFHDAHGYAYPSTIHQPPSSIQDRDESIWGQKEHQQIVTGYLFGHSANQTSMHSWSPKTV